LEKLACLAVIGAGLDNRQSVTFRNRIRVTDPNRVRIIELEKPTHIEIGGKTRLSDSDQTFPYTFTISPLSVVTDNDVNPARTFVSLHVEVKIEKGLDGNSRAFAITLDKLEVPAVGTQTWNFKRAGGKK
jgi:hypothetical protein